jgi:hypothetical protein
MSTVTRPGREPTAPVISTSAENRCLWTGQHHRQTLLEVAAELNVAGGARVGARQRRVVLELRIQYLLLSESYWIHKVC